MSLRQFDRVFHSLAAAGLRAIAVDVPGFGSSDPPDHPPSIEEYASITPAILDHLGVSNACVLGHHTGAEIATAAAANFADRVFGLILNGPVPFSEKEREDGLAYVESEEKGFEHREDGQHLVTAFKNRMAYANPNTRWNLATRYVAEQFMGLGPFWYGHHAAFTYDHGATIADISHPTLILTNTGDAIYHLAQRAKRLRPDFQYAEIEGGGVDIIDEKPEAWTAHVVKFVTSVHAGK